MNSLLIGFILLFVVLGATFLISKVKHCGRRRSVQKVVALLLLATVTASASEAPPEQLFRADELSISLYGTGAIGTADRVKEVVSVGTGLGADYYVTRGFGFGLRAEASDFTHSVVDRSSGRVLVRAPLWDRVAPYGYAEGGFDFERDHVFAGCGGGIEFRLNKNVGTFAELGLETTTRGEATGRAAAGIRFPF